MLSHYEELSFQVTHSGAPHTVGPQTIELSAPLVEFGEESLDLLLPRPTDGLVDRQRAHAASSTSPASAPGSSATGAATFGLTSVIATSAPTTSNPTSTERAVWKP
jgi:hypothetical protein